MASLFSLTTARLPQRSSARVLSDHLLSSHHSLARSGALAEQLPWSKPQLSALCMRRRGLCLASLSSSSGLGGGQWKKDGEEGREKERTRVHASISRTSGGGEQPQPGGGEGPRASTSWIDRYLPEGTRPYAHLARLDKPIGTWLFAWPCFWSVALAASPGGLPDLKLIALFGCASVLIRGAACTVNDYFDRDFDSQVERTKTRPLASGAVTPFQGLSFYAFQVLLTAGFFLQLNTYSQILGAFLVPLLSSYPLMKRITYWPQAYLGVGFNWGALLGWAALRGSLDPAVVLPLYVSGVFWTLVYDTIYAHQDKEDDVQAGVKSTALMFGDSTKYWVTGFGIACIGALALSGYNAQLAWPYYLFLTAAAGQLAWQIFTVDLSNGADCNRKFISNEWFGAFVFLAILFGRFAI